jgi:glutamate-1-semialdehyde 2,1-aminomutase
LQASRGVQVCDLDGNWFYDLTGSYGVNVLGYDFYKDCMDRGAALVRDLGPVLGAYHPIMGYILRRLREVSGHEQASFHMSGTEAVMQAVRLALYHTRRRRIVRFCGAYHGWWGDVQPGVGNPQNPPDTLTLSDMSEKSLTVLRTRKDIACVLINPLQALHPNANAPADSGLIDGVRSAQYNRESYTRWLQQLRQVCTERGIVLIFDEVFLGFRLAMGGAQAYFGVQADLVTYGKTLGGGFPVGAVCGPAELMKRYRDQRPADITFARGTFKEHPYVMGAMHEFLRFLESDEARVIYDGVDERWNQRAVQLNQRLQAADLPLRVANMSSVWTVTYTQPGRYNWMLQYYLRAEGLALSWVGTGRFIFSLNYSDADFAAVADRVLLAAEAMRRDGWWWSEPSLTRKSIKQRILGETRRAWFSQRTA